MKQKKCMFKKKYSKLLFLLNLEKRKETNLQTSIQRIHVCLYSYEVLILLYRTLFFLNTLLCKKKLC